VEKKSQKISAAVREALQKELDSGVTRYAIGKATGVSESSLLRWLSGERGISVDTLDTLAAYLGVRVTRKGR
jgi:transcriptional regulator with XRE-family HTH domain